MGKIVAIGGAMMEPLFINESLQLSEVKHPKVLVLPTGDLDEELKNGLITVYGFKGKFNCDVEALDNLWELYAGLKHRSLNDIQQELEVAREKVLGADVIYVPAGGFGNTLLMVEAWETLGIADTLREAHDKGAVLAGSSCGALCWFKGGLSDSEVQLRRASANTIIDGLGIVEAVFAPYFSAPKERLLERRLEEDLREEARYAQLPAIGVGMSAAVIIDGDEQRYKVMSAGSLPNTRGFKIKMRQRRGSHPAYRVWHDEKSEYHIKKLPVDEWRPLDELLAI